MKMEKVNSKKLWKSILFVLIAFSLNAQDVPFNCDYNAYLFQFNDIYAIDLASGNTYLTAKDVAPGKINGAAYNPVDGYIWASLSEPDKSIIRIGKNYDTTIFYIDELPLSNRYVGGINAQGIYYLKGGGKTYYKIDLDTGSTTYSQHLATENLSLNINIHDWAFNAVDSQLYTVEKKTNNLYRIDPSDGTVLSLGEVPILSGLKYTYGAVYFDASGRFYVSANQTGTIYVIQDVQNLDGTNAMNSNIFAFGPSSSSNDGARCPTAPVPQEDCKNGIDDDEDGLVDCDDPSCSGVAACPVIEAPTSGANAGGLESNSRLSDLISKRNYNRLKNNYKFDRASAPRLTAVSRVDQKNKRSGLKLEDFIPLNVINEDAVIESSPTDLTDITNATEIYSVDYMENNESVASILILKTDNGVYEHTKYICDRLTGAELIGVSTIEVDSTNFIRSIIKNADQSTEFTLSFSAKAVNNDNDFLVESHWNIDKYEDNVPFYNFQIWSNSIDDLILLSEEVIHLLDTQKTIVGYNTSEPPTVFVRKGEYNNGKLDLQIINTNLTQEVDFDAGLRETETSNTDDMTSSIVLDSNYVTNVQIPTGNLFDIGFRIGDGVNTPDDLFLSDGAWGTDVTTNTTVNTYEVLPNTISFDSTEFPVERNLSLNVTTSDYIAAFKTIKPTFQPVDLTAYNSFKLSAKGTGDLEIRFIKQSINDWEEQYKTIILLSSNLQEFTLPFTQFSSTLGSNLVLDDLVSINFKMTADNGAMVTKEMNLEHLRFSTESILANVNDLNGEQEGVPVVVPNPVVKKASIYLTAPQEESVTVFIYDQDGKVVDQFNVNIVKGENKVKFDRKELTSGSYLLKISSLHNYFKPVKFVVE